MNHTSGSDKKLISSLPGVLLIVGIPILVFLLELFLDTSFSKYGLLSRDITGLRGILFMPFLHADWSHLISNLSALFVLSWLGLYTFGRSYWIALIFIWLSSGTWIWFFARPDYHIGASGVVYGITVFSFVSGFLSKNRNLQGLTLLTAFLYGSFLWGVFPWEYTRDISWEGHLAGAVAGLIVAFVLRTDFPPPPEYSWDKEPEPEITPEDAYWLPEEHPPEEPR